MKERIAFIGAGGVAQVLSAALHQGGYTITAVVSRSMRSAQRCGSGCGAGVVSRDVKDIPKDTEIFFITTPDDQIALVAETLLKTGLLTEATVVIHTSAAMPASVLDPVKVHGAKTFSFHPMQTFCKGLAPELAGVAFAFEGDEEAFPLARRLVEGLGGWVLKVWPEQKPLYHLGAILASNYLVTLLAQVEKLYGPLGFSRETCYRIIEPLARQSLRNASWLGGERALTGPIARGDLKTVRSHLVTLRERVPDLTPLYTVLGRLTLKLAQDGGRLDHAGADRLRKLLAEFEEGLNHSG
ncbi:DUF2520 domain-containing protein [candidate division KSB1 bacterium]|nr:DUF2520 domain-containing protein [candidate division KSB1 bacterium]